MNDEVSGESHERPMTEAEWEQLMRESEARSAKFGELLETLIDHPDRDAIIEREMGWDRDDGDSAEPAFAEGIEAEPATDEELAKFQREQKAVEEIPAFARSREWAMNVWSALEHVDADETSILAEQLQEAIGGSMSVSVKIAGGHGMGYDDQSLCGNIVRCKKALEAADESLRALKEIQEGGHVPAATIEPLIANGLDIRALVEAWIAELRERVWWE